MFCSYGGIGWNSSVPLLNPRNHLESAVLDGKLYAISSQYSQDPVTQSSRPHIWNPAKSNTKTTVARLSRPRSHIGAATLVMDGWSVVAESKIRYGELFTSSRVHLKGYRSE